MSIYSTLAQGGFNAATAGLSYLINSSLAREARDENYMYNEMAARNADQRARALYQDQYSIKAQMQNAKEAGLSPSLFYQGQGTIGQGGAQGAGAGGVGAPYIPVSPVDMAGIELTKAQAEKTKAETENINKDTELKGQEIINLVTENGNKRLQGRLIAAEADLRELEYMTDVQTMEATIAEAYSNSLNAANIARSSGVRADLDESTFNIAYQQAWANLDKTLTDTALEKSQIKVNTAQIKEIAERIRASQWETWATEKQENRNDAIFKLDKARLEAEVKKWAMENNTTLATKQMEVVSDLVGYVCNFARVGLTNATKKPTKPKK